MYKESLAVSGVVVGRSTDQQSALIVEPAWTKEVFK